MKYLKKANVANPLITDILLAKELVNNDEYLSLLRYERIDDTFARFNGEDWLSMTTKDVTRTMLFRAVKYSWSCPSEVLEKAVEISKAILPSYSKNYAETLKKDVRKFLKHVLIKTENCTIYIGDRDGFKELKTVTALQEFASEGLYPCYLAWFVMQDFAEDLRSPLNRRCFNTILDFLLIELYDVCVSEEDTKDGIIRGFSFNRETYPFKLSRTAKDYLKENLHEVFGTLE